MDKFTNYIFFPSTILVISGVGGKSELVDTVLTGDERDIAMMDVDSPSVADPASKLVREAADGADEEQSTVVSHIYK